MGQRLEYSCFKTWEPSFILLLPVSFGRDRLPGVCAREVKDPTQGLNVQPAVDSISHESQQKRPRRGSVNSANYLARGREKERIANMNCKLRGLKEEDISVVDRGK